MIKQEIFNDSAICLADYVDAEHNEWVSFENHLKEGLNPFNHIIFDVCVVSNRIEEDFLKLVEELSTDEYKKMVHDFIVNEMGE